MGVNLKDLVVSKPVDISILENKKVAIDAYNVIYQFLSAIRQRDGTPLMDSKGRVTSHLSGLFYRTLNLMERGVKPCFVFDGQAPDLKAQTQAVRREIREAATEKYEAAKRAGDIEAAKKYAQQTSRLTSDMIKESKELLEAMGLPWIQAISDAEAQAAYMCAKGQVYAVVSQDYDSLLFGTPRLVRNLTISGKRKKAGKSEYTEVAPEVIDLAENLNALKLDLKGLVHIAMLIGTDFNPGVKGVGPKKAFQIVKDGKFSEFKGMIEYADRVEKIFLKPPITTTYNLEWKPANETKIMEILSDRHDFGEIRIKAALNRLKEASKSIGQKGLDTFF